MRNGALALLSLAAVLLAGCEHLAASTPEQGAAMKAMTFNIRLDVASDGANAWDNRKELVFALIRQEAPAILAMQEVLPNQRDDLEAALPDYETFGTGRDDGTRQGGEAALCAWRRGAFTLEDGGTFWLSPTPEIATKAWDAAYPRTASWVILRRNADGRRLQIVCTHFDHVGKLARTNSARQILKFLGDGPGKGLPAIVLGDFNTTPGTRPYQILSEFLEDSRIASRTPPYGPPGTFNGWRIDSDADAPIDHIFVSAQFAVSAYSVLTQHWGGRLPSDHYPVTAILALRR